ncbi:ankyrin repeat-containing domain protein [Fusarium avenaceum]|nr:ankyrin repeat-containing domain protein [Fusarium avenaceum]
MSAREFSRRNFGGNLPQPPLPETPLPETPLSEALKAGNQALFKELLEDPENHRDINTAGHDYLEAAIILNRQEIVRALVSLPLSEFDFPNRPGAPTEANSHLDLSISFERFAIFKIIVDTGKVDISKPDSDGRTPLHLASAIGATHIVQLMLQYDNVKADVKDNEGRTPLYLAAYGGMSNVVEILLRLDTVDPDSKDMKGRSPFWWALRYGYDSIATMLADTGRVDRSVEEEAIMTRNRMLVLDRYAPPTFATRYGRHN